MKHIKGKSGVLVCVTDQLSCERLIRAGKKIADEINAPLQVLSVQPANQTARLMGEALDYLFEVSGQNGAEMTIYYHDDSILMVAGHILKYNVRHVVTGLPGEVQSVGFVEAVHSLCPNVPFSLVSEDQQMITLGAIPQFVQKVGAASRSV